MFLSEIAKTGGFDEDKRQLVSLVEEKGYDALAKIVVDMGDSMIPLRHAARYMNMSMDMLVDIAREATSCSRDVMWAALAAMNVASETILLVCKFPNLKNARACIEVPEGSGILCEKSLVMGEALVYAKPDSAYNERQRRADDAFIHIALAYQLSKQLYTQLHVGNRKLLVGYVCAQFEQYIDYMKNHYVLIMRALDDEEVYRNWLAYNENRRTGRTAQ
ncbi:hypothetical protein AGMMS49992_11650 [Clostridia bacterium]|nr:hypothetical protein AGMMS49992_11650 [Clostridia bacterium]